MDSINANQPDDNHEDLRGSRAVEQIREVVNKSASCFFCTAVSHGSTGATRPMSVQEVDAAGNLWFLSATDSHKNRELAENPNVHQPLSAGRELLTDPAGRFAIYLAAGTGPHSATTRCAPLPGLPFRIVPVFRSVMTTSSFFAVESA